MLAELQSSFTQWRSADGADDPCSRRTPLAGHPPFSWEQSANDALTLRGLAHLSDWSLPAVLYRLEGYNGYGYHFLRPPINSPYLWSFSNHYTCGKFVADCDSIPTPFLSNAERRCSSSHGAAAAGDFDRGRGVSFGGSPPDCLGTESKKETHSFTLGGVGLFLLPAGRLFRASLADHVQTGYLKISVLLCASFLLFVGLAYLLLVSRTLGSGARQGHLLADVITEPSLAVVVELQVLTFRGDEKVAAVGSTPFWRQPVTVFAGPSDRPPAPRRMLPMHMLRHRTRIIQGENFFIRIPPITTAIVFHLPSSSAVTGNTPASDMDGRAPAHLLPIETRAQDRCSADLRTPRQHLRLPKRHRQSRRLHWSSVGRASPTEESPCPTQPNWHPSIVCPSPRGGR